MGSRLPSRRTEIARLRAPLEESRYQPVKLTIVASMLHRELSARSRDSMHGPEYAKAIRAITLLSNEKAPA